MKHESKQRSHEQEHLVTSSTGQTVSRESVSTDELLRKDASLVEVPPEIAVRLAESLRQTPPPKRPWWKRFLARR